MLVAFARSEQDALYNGSFFSCPCRRSYLLEAMSSQNVMKGSVKVLWGRFF
jgi:hypothetical protein